MYTPRWPYPSPPRIYLPHSYGTTAQERLRFLLPCLFQVLRELRVKGALMDHKEIRAAMGVKIVAPGLESAVAGTSLFVVGPDVSEGGSGQRCGDVSLFNAF